MAMELAQRRLRGGPADEKTLARLRRLLLGRGFGSETVDSVLNQIGGQTEH